MNPRIDTPQSSPALLSSRPQGVADRSDAGERPRLDRRLDRSFERSLQQAREQRSDDRSDRPVRTDAALPRERTNERTNERAREPEPTARAPHRVAKPGEPADGNASASPRDQTQEAPEPSATVGDRRISDSERRAPRGADEAAAGAPASPTLAPPAEAAPLPEGPKAWSLPATAAGAAEVGATALPVEPSGEATAGADDTMTFNPDRGSAGTPAATQSAASTALAAAGAAGRPVGDPAKAPPVEGASARQTPSPTAPALGSVTESPTATAATAATGRFASRVQQLLEESTATRLPPAVADNPATAPAGAASPWQQAVPALTSPATHPAATAEPPVLQGRLAAHPASPQFVPQLGAQLEMFIREGVQSARLQLHPAELGPVAVQLQLEGSQASVVLAAEHPLTREKLLEALPQLARQLQDQGLSWAGGSVGSQLGDSTRPHDGGAASQGDRRDGRTGSSEPGTASAAGGADTRETPARRSRGIVDLVA